MTKKYSLTSLDLPNFDGSGLGSINEKQETVIQLLTALRDTFVRAFELNFVHAK